MAVRLGAAAAAAAVVQHTISIHVDKTKGNSQTGTVEATGSRSSSGTVIPFACFTRHSTTSSKSHYNFFLASFFFLLLLCMNRPKPITSNKTRVRFSHLFHDSSISSRFFDLFMPHSCQILPFFSRFFDLFLPICVRFFHL